MFVVVSAAAAFSQQSFICSAAAAPQLKQTVWLTSLLCCKRSQERSPQLCGNVGHVRLQKCQSSDLILPGLDSSGFTAGHQPASATAVLQPRAGCHRGRITSSAWDLTGLWICFCKIRGFCWNICFTVQGKLPPMKSRIWVSCRLKEAHAGALIVSVLLQLSAFSTSFYLIYSSLSLGESLTLSLQVFFNISLQCLKFSAWIIVLFLYSYNSSAVFWNWHLKNFSHYEVVCLLLKELKRPNTKMCFNTAALFYK